MYHIHHLTTRTTRTSCTTHGWKSQTSIDLAANLLVDHRNEILARYWPAGNMANHDTKTTMASRRRKDIEEEEIGRLLLLGLPDYGRLLRFI